MGMNINMDMDEFEKFIFTKLKLSDIDKNIEYKTKQLSDAYFIVFLDKMIKTNYFLYSKQQYSKIHNFNMSYPLYDIESKEFIINIDFALFSNKPDEIIILPILIFNNTDDDMQYVHIVTFHIDIQRKTILYFDSYGYTNNEMISKTNTNNMIKIVKSDLLINDIISDDYKLIVLDTPWQNHIKDENVSWYFYDSCMVLQSIFALFYHNILHRNTKKIDILQIFNALNLVIKKNPNKFKEIVGLVYIYVMYY